MTKPVNQNGHPVGRVSTRRARPNANLALITCAVLLPILSACDRGPLAKAALDKEVRRLCEIDGGIKVYETVKLLPQAVNQNGLPTIRISKDSSDSTGAEYYYEWELHYYRKGNPEMWRSEHRIVRTRDKKIMGRQVRYIRRGGDLPSPAHDSSFECPELGARPSLEESVFVKGEQE